MNVIGSSLIIILFLCVVPVLIGSLWIGSVRLVSLSERIVFSLLMGFFSMLAIWQLLVVPMAVMHISFLSICYLYLGVIFIVCLAALKRFLKDDAYQFHGPSMAGTLYEHIYMLLFAVLFLIQLYFAVFYSRTYMADDGYAVYSAMALEDNYVFMTYPYTGVSVPFSSQWIRRVVQTELYFPGVLSLLSGVDVATICNTVLNVFVTAAGYGAYYLISADMFEKKEDRWLFLIFVSLLYVFGYHSHYSLTFRMLGPNYEGKAILAVVVTPFMLLFLRWILRDGYSSAAGLRILVLSLASMSLTLGGAYTFAALVGAIVLTGFFVKRDFKMFLFALWGAVIPAVYASLYAFLLLG